VIAAIAAAAPSIARIPASPANYARGHRPASAVRLVVVHVVEGTYWGAISWFRNPRARASAHYVVSREGAVAEMVPRWKVAWHAGNGWVNRHSIGIEHEGYSAISGLFTDAEYRSSARLVGSVLRRYRLPADRRHVIGHAEVRDPFRPWLRGGFAHHTDPGRQWNWTRFMSYVRSYARGATPPPLPLDVTTNLRLLQTLTRGVRWQAFPLGAEPDRVEFVVDGQLRETVRAAPYVFSSGAWNTAWERNGRHVVKARVVAVDGRVATASALVMTRNRLPRVTALNLVDGDTVSGLVEVEATVTPAPQRVQLLVDGVVRGTATAAPYRFEWDTTAEPAGPHRLTVRAVVRGYGVSGRSASVVVTPPAPVAAPPTP